MVHKRSVWLQLWLAGLVLLPGIAPGAALAREYSPKEEERIGKQGCAEIEKEMKVLDDPAQLKRVEEILKVLTPLTPRPEVVYHAKILQTDDVNALSLPGGFIYVTKGLLDLVESDDELAGVIAHEMAHNVHMHALKGLDRAAKLDRQLMLLLIGGLLLSQEGADPGAIIVMGQLLKMNALNGYGRKAETEADASAVEYLAASKRYNPCGMLQFMETLQREENRRPHVELGVFRTHPPTPDRVAAIRAALEARHIPIVRLPGKNTPKAVARPVTVNGREAAEVVVKDRVLFQPASAGGRSAMERAEAAARNINGIFREYVEERHIRIRAEGSNYVVICRETPLLTVTPADAALHAAAAADLAESAAKALKAVIWQDFIRTSPLTPGSFTPPPDLR